jgi:hypothetical protein
MKRCFNQIFIKQEHQPLESTLSLETQGAESSRVMTSRETGRAREHVVFKTQQLGQELDLENTTLTITTDKSVPEEAQQLKHIPKERSKTPTRKVTLQGVSLSNLNRNIFIEILTA